MGVTDSTEQEREWQRRAVSAMVDAVVTADLEGRITSWNGAAERLFGYEAPDIIGQHIARLVGEGREWEAHDILARVSGGETYSNPDAIRRRSNGAPFDVALTWAPLRDATGTLHGMVGVFRDISRAKGVDRALQERRASDIQASYVTSLFAVSLDLEMAAAQDSMANAAPLIESARESIAALIDHVRADADQLQRLNIPEEGGVDAKLTAIARQLVPRTIDVLLNLEAIEARDGLEEAVVYIATEALINAVRHSAATRIAVDLRDTSGSTVLLVQDDGGGFEPERVSRGLGLGRMRLWATRSNGELMLYSVPGMGTTVRLTAPS